MPALTPEAFQRQTGVSRETLERLRLYADLLKNWNRRINLVGAATIGDLWRRHLLDSAQLFALLPSGTRVLVDLGSGAGLPGLVLAILGIPEIHLVESDARKCAFLREAARIVGCAVTLHPRRIAQIPGFVADAVTARGLAPVAQLLDHAEKFCGEHSILLFLKGRSVQEELTEARKGWMMRATLLPSVSDPSGTVLRLEKVVRGGNSGDI
ncbi:MAG: 16S rRNA (guanine(527)-N(7))-methyltransferase RsmG [Alphaproteobacteria bacterium]|nr:16S rRNA (guanine(527)-N(7))-methyltransferase RsmG [Alphaproteobacteria bacterium]